MQELEEDLRMVGMMSLLCGSSYGEGGYLNDDVMPNLFSSSNRDGYRPAGI